MPIKKNILKIVNWVKGSVEYRGRASARKLTTLAAFILLCCMAIVHMVTGAVIQEIFVIVFAIIPLIGLGYMTAQNIVDIFKRGDSVYAGQMFDIENRKLPNGKPTSGEVEPGDPVP